MYNYLPKALYESLLAQAKADVLTAKATLQIYFENSMGIGEHPQHTEEMAKLLDKVAMAEDRTSVLERHYQAIYGEMKHEPKKL
tara:strand:- start:507 stop:758 length:252 start_codon:yes stop_codon:yes gene_type:complete